MSLTMNPTVTTRGQLYSKMQGLNIMTKESKILKCPECGSSNIVPETGFVTGYKYHCNECGYVGPFIIEEYVKENEEK